MSEIEISENPDTYAHLTMFARRSVSLALSARSFSTSALRLSEKSALEVRLRDALKDAMKARDKASVSTLKVGWEPGLGLVQAACGEENS